MQCVTCGADETPFQCAQCRTSTYCNAQCQQKGWASTHARVCAHLRTFAGRRKTVQPTSDDSRERDGFADFVKAYGKLGYSRSSSRPYKAAGPICDVILQFVADYLPEVDIASIDTADWHESVAEDVREDDGTDTDMDQLWRNLPDSIAAVFLSGRAHRDVQAGVKRGGLAPMSSTNIDRSLLSLLPGDLQLMLLHDLPAYSVLAVIDDPADSIVVNERPQKIALKALVQRDVFGPLALYPNSGLTVPEHLMMPLQEFRRATEAMEEETYASLRMKYDTLTGHISAQLMQYNILFPEKIVAMGPYQRNIAVARYFILEGRHFALRFTQHIVQGRPKARWMCHPTAAKRIWKILPRELAQAIARFSTSEDQAAALDVLIELVVHKIDIGVKWVFDANKNALWRKYLWEDDELTATFGALGVVTYSAIPQVLIIGPETSYRLVAFRFKLFNPSTKYKDLTPSTMKERSQ